VHRADLFFAALANLLLRLAFVFILDEESTFAVKPGVCNPFPVPMPLLPPLAERAESG
jgi:hypothetical protein